MAFAGSSASTPCVKAGFLHSVLSRLRGRLQRGKQAVKTFSTACPDSCLISITGRGSWLSPYGRLDEQHAVMPDNPADWPLERLDQHEASVSQLLRDDFLGNPVPTSISRYPRRDRLTA